MEAEFTQPMWDIKLAWSHDELRNSNLLTQSSLKLLYKSEPDLRSGVKATGSPICPAEASLAMSCAMPTSSTREAHARPDRARDMAATKAERTLSRMLASMAAP